MKADDKHPAKGILRAFFVFLISAIAHLELSSKEPIAYVDLIAKIAVYRAISSASRCFLTSKDLR